MKEKKAGARMSPVTVKTLVKRLSLGTAVVLLAVFLILWDAGILVIPGLVSPERRRFFPDDTLTQNRETKVEVDWAAWAQDQIDALYDVSRLEAPLSNLTSGTFNGAENSLVRQSFSGAERLSVYGGLILAEKDGVTRFYQPGTADLSKLSKEARALLESGDAYPLLTIDSLKELDAENARLTQRQTREGLAVFEKADKSGYLVYDPDEGVFKPYTPGLAWELTDWETVPGDEGDGSGLTLICENGLYGYRGSYTDGARTVEVTVPCVYTVAFPYAEGAAVMADEAGRVTVLNARGEEILTDRNLLLRDGWENDEASGTFSRGLLRSTAAVYREDGSLLSRNEEIVSLAGKRFSLPEGFRAAAYSEGVFTVTNGEQYGYYSAEGTWIGTPSYSYGTPFREGIATVVDQDGKEGLISREGKELLAPAFTEIGAFSKGLAVLRDDAVGQMLLWKVKGIYPPPGEEVPEATDRSYYERIPLSRGPRNTFDDEDDIIIVLPDLEAPPWVTTGAGEATRPVYSVPASSDNPVSSSQAPAATEGSSAETPPESSSQTVADPT